MIKFHLSLTFRNVDVILVRTLAALESMQINIWHQNDSICEKGEKILFELFDPKNYIILIGVTPNGKKFFFFDFRHQNGSIREKKAKKYFKHFDPKKFYHPRWDDLQWAKITKKFFFAFLASE